MSYLFPLPNGSAIRVPSGTPLSVAEEWARRDFPDLYKEEEQAAPEKPQREGFFANVAEGARAYGDSSGVGFRGIFDPESAKEAAQRSIEAGQGTKSVNWQDVKDAYEQGGLGDAASAAGGFARDTIGQAIPQIGATVLSAKAGALAGSVAGPVGAGIGALVGGIGANVLPAFGGNIERQVQESPDAPIDRSKAATAAAGMAALDALPVLGLLGKLGVGKVAGEALQNLAKKTPAEIEAKLVASAQQSLLAASGKGAAMGVAVEMPTEVAQTVLERWQAGMPLTGADAYAEYEASAAGGGVVGAPLGAAGRVYERSDARGTLDTRARTAEAEQRQQEAVAERQKKEAEKARRASPEGLLELDAQYQAVQDELKAIKDAEKAIVKPEQNSAEALKKKQLRALYRAKAEEYRPVTEAWVAAEQRIAEVKEQQRKDAMSPEEYFYEQSGMPPLKPPADEATTLEEAAAQNQGQTAAPEQTYVQRQVALAEQYGATSENDIAEFLLADRDAARELVKNQTPIPGLRRKESNTVLKKIAKALQETDAAETARMQAERPDLAKPGKPESDPLALLRQSQEDDEVARLRDEYLRGVTSMPGTEPGEARAFAEPVQETGAYDPAAASAVEGKDKKAALKPLEDQYQTALADYEQKRGTPEAVEARKAVVQAREALQEEENRLFGEVRPGLQLEQQVPQEDFAGLEALIDRALEKPAGSPLIADTELEGRVQRFNDIREDLVGKYAQLMTDKSVGKAVPAQAEDQAKREIALAALEEVKAQRELNGLTPLTIPDDAFIAQFIRRLDKDFTNRGARKDGAQKNKEQITRLQGQLEAIRNRLRTAQEEIRASGLEDVEDIEATAAGKLAKNLYKASNTIASQIQELKNDPTVRSTAKQSSIQPQIDAIENRIASIEGQMQRRFQDQLPEDVYVRMGKEKQALQRRVEKMRLRSDPYFRYDQEFNSVIDRQIATVSARLRELTGVDADRDERRAGGGASAFAAKNPKDENEVKRLVDALFSLRRKRAIGYGGDQIYRISQNIVDNYARRGKKLSNAQKEAFNARGNARRIPSAEGFTLGGRQLPANPEGPFKPTEDEKKLVRRLREEEIADIDEAVTSGRFVGEQAAKADRALQQLLSRVDAPVTQDDVARAKEKFGTTQPDQPDLFREGTDTALRQAAGARDAAQQGLPEAKQQFGKALSGMRGKNPLQSAADRLAEKFGKTPTGQGVPYEEAKQRLAEAREKLNEVKARVEAAEADLSGAKEARLRADQLERDAYARSLRRNLTNILANLRKPETVVVARSLTEQIVSLLRKIDRQLLPNVRPDRFSELSRAYVSAVAEAKQKIAGINALTKEYASQIDALQESLSERPVTARDLRALEAAEKEIERIEQAFEKEKLQQDIAALTNKSDDAAKAAEDIFAANKPFLDEVATLEQEIAALIARAKETPGAEAVADTEESRYAKAAEKFGEQQRKLELLFNVPETRSGEAPVRAVEGTYGKGFYEADEKQRKTQDARLAREDARLQKQAESGIPAISFNNEKEMRIEVPEDASTKLRLKIAEWLRSKGFDEQADAVEDDAADVTIDDWLRSKKKDAPKGKATSVNIDAKRVDTTGTEDVAKAIKAAKAQFENAVKQGQRETEIRPQKSKGPQGFRTGVPEKEKITGNKGKRPKSQSSLPPELQAQAREDDARALELRRKPDLSDEDARELQKIAGRRASREALLIKGSRQETQGLVSEKSRADLDTPRGDVFFSRGGTNTGNTIKGVVDELEGIFGERGLIRGNVLVYESPEALMKEDSTFKGRIPADARGMVVNRKAYLFANNIPKGNALAILLHEVGAHVGFRNLFSEAEYKQLVSAVKAWATRPANTIENKIFRKALNRVEAANTPANQRDDELLAYAVEEAVNAEIAPTGSGKGPLSAWLWRIIDVFKKALEQFGISPQKLTAQQLVDMAYGAANLELKGTYHGSPWRFDKFDHSFMGSGEGTQWEGWGTYRAQKRGAASTYLFPEKALKKFLESPKGKEWQKKKDEILKQYQLRYKGMSFKDMAEAMEDADGRLNEMQTSAMAKKLGLSLFELDALQNALFAMQKQLYNGTDYAKAMYAENLREIGVQAIEGMKTRYTADELGKYVKLAEFKNFPRKVYAATGKTAQEASSGYVMTEKLAKELAKNIDLEKIFGPTNGEVLYKNKLWYSDKITEKERVLLYEIVKALKDKKVKNNEDIVRHLPDILKENKEDLRYTYELFEKDSTFAKEAARVKEDLEIIDSFKVEDFYTQTVEPLPEIPPEGRPNLYRTLHASDDNEVRLDWDKPVAMQSDFVKQQFEKAFDSLSPPQKRIFVKNVSGDENKATGRDIYKSLADALEYGNPELTRREEGVTSKAERVASELLYSFGIAGVKYRDGISRYKGDTQKTTYNFVDFSDKEAEIVFRNLNPIGPAKEPLFSRGASAQYASKEVGEAARTMIGKDRGAVAKIREAATGLGFRVRMVDNYAGLKKALEQGDAGFAIQVSYDLMNFAQRNHFVQQTVMNGAPTREWWGKEGNKDVYKTEVKDGPSLRKVSELLAEVKGYGNAQGVSDAFTLLAVGKRAQSKDWDRVFADAEKDTPEQLTKKAEARAVAKRLADELDKGNSPFAAAYAEYQGYNKNMLRFAMQAGVISEQDFRDLSRDENYTPLFRADKNGNLVLQLDAGRDITVGKIGDEAHLKEMFGGSGQVMDFFTASVRNASILIDASLHNIAAREAGFALEAMGAAKKVGNTVKNPNVIEFRVKGEKDIQRFEIDTDAFGIPTDLVVKGFAGVPASLPGWVRLMGMPATLLRKTVTRNPLYMFRQLIRDPMNAWLVTGANMDPISGTLSELGKSLTGKADTTLDRRGITGGMLFSEDIADIERIQDAARKAPPWSVGYWMAKLDDMALAADAITRRNVYNGSIKEGASEIQATISAYESMPFSKRGTSPSMRYLNHMVPFLSATVQGLDVVYRAAKGDMPLQDRVNIRNKLLQRGAMIAGLTALYAMSMEDNEQYKNANTSERMNSWFIPVPGSTMPLKLPVPFELGIIFKMIPEAMVRIMYSDKEIGSEVRNVG
jgi:hypothetical protein